VVARRSAVRGQGQGEGCAFVRAQRSAQGSGQRWARPLHPAPAVAPAWAGLRLWIHVHRPYASGSPGARLLFCSAGEGAHDTAAPPEREPMPDACRREGSMGGSCHAVRRDSWPQTTWHVAELRVRVPPRVLLRWPALAAGGLWACGLVGWLVGWLVGYGWLVRWLAGPLARGSMGRWWLGDAAVVVRVVVRLCSFALWPLVWMRVMRRHTCAERAYAPASA
jgi:hypothetical protein